MSLKVGIIGAGSWGTAIGCAFAASCQDMWLYSNKEELIEEINCSHSNNNHLAGINLPPNLRATGDLTELYNICDMLIIATPSYAFLDIVQLLSQTGVPEHIDILIASKGLCSAPAMLFSSKFESILVNRYGFMAGPNLAMDIAQSKAASMTIASVHSELITHARKALDGTNIISEGSSDIITIQIAGIVKNIAAIGCAIMRAQGSGQNEIASFITGSLQDIAAISGVFGGKIKSLSLYAVAGDLMLTCYSSISRNSRFGKEWHISGYNRDFLQNCGYLVEGARGAVLLHELLANYDIKLNLENIIHKLLSLKQQ